MPLRSPKMYFCIFGFHRLVWWPKCTPASRSSFIVRAAMGPPSVVPPPRSGSPGVPPKWRGVRDGRLRRVLRVDAYVLLAEIAREDVGLAPSQPEVDGDRVGRPRHGLADPLVLRAVAQHSPLDQQLVLEGHGDLVRLHPGRRLADRHQPDRKSTRLNSSHSQISYAVFCLKKKKKDN